MIAGGDDVLLRDGLDLLLSLLESGADPERALRRLRTLQDRDTAIRQDLIWEQDSTTQRWDYDLLIRHPRHGTITLSVVPRDGVPFSLRRLQRNSDMLLVRVDGRPLMVYEAMTFFDTVWEDHPLLNRIVNFCIIQRVLEDRPIEVPLEELQRGMDAFRVARGLMTAEATETWLSSRGMSLAELELKVANEIRLRLFRSREVGEAAHSAFQADATAFDWIALAAFPVPAEKDAGALAAEIRRTGGFLEVATRTLAARTSDRRAARSITFESLPRRDVELLEPCVDPVPGCVVAARLRGTGPYVVSVEHVREAKWDTSTREAVEVELFDRWIAERRAAAHIEWNWGKSNFSSQ